MKGIYPIFFIFIALSLPAPVFAFQELASPDGSITALVDYIFTDSALNFHSDPTIFFINEEDGTRFRGTYHRLRNELKNYSAFDVLEILEWVDNDTIVVKGSYEWDASDWGSFVYEISTDGHTEFVRIEDVLPENQNRLFVELGGNEYTDEWDLYETAVEIEWFLDELCADEDLILQSLPGIHPSFPYNTMSEYLGCQYLVSYIEEIDDGLIYVSLTDWHGRYFVFDRDEQENLILTQFSPPMTGRF